MSTTTRMLTQDEYLEMQRELQIRKSFPIASCLYDIMRENGHIDGTGHVEDVLSDFFGQIRSTSHIYWPEDYNPLDSMRLLEVLGLVNK